MAPLLSTVLLHTQSDQRLLALAADGHDRAFETIVERYRGPLMRACRRVLPETRVDDVVQATFVRAWSALQAGAEVRELRPWLYRIAHNQAVDALGRKGYDHDELHESLAADPGATPDVDVERREVMRSTLTSLAALPERQRAALLAVAVAGRDHADVASELGLTDGGLRQLLFRARSQIRAAAAAVIPAPLVLRALETGSAGTGDTTRTVAELVTGGGTVGLTGVALKVGAVAAAVGVFATQAPHILGGHRAPTSAHAAAAPVHGSRAAHGRSAAISIEATPVAAIPVSAPSAARSPSASSHGSGGSSHGSGSSHRSGGSSHGSGGSSSGSSGTSGSGGGTGSVAEDGHHGSDGGGSSSAGTEGSHGSGTDDGPSDGEKKKTPGTTKQSGKTGSSDGSEQGSSGDGSETGPDDGAPAATGQGASFDDDSSSDDGSRSSGAQPPSTGAVTVPTTSGDGSRHGHGDGDSSGSPDDGSGGD